MAKHLLTAAIVAYLLAWPLPSLVISDPGPFAPYTHAVRGWEATRSALLPVWPRQHASVTAGWFRQLLMVASALTNLLFVTAALVAGVRPQRVPRWLAGAVWIAALVNLHWLVGSKSDRDMFRLGYYLWVTSFVWLAIALGRIRQMRPTEAPPRPAA